MIKYLTTLNDIVGSHVKYYMYSKLTVSQANIGSITLNNLLPADMTLSSCRQVSGDTYELVVQVNNTGEKNYPTIGSIIFVVDDTLVGYYNLPKLVSIKQSTNYQFKIRFDQVECNITNMVISTDIIKHNPNLVPSEKDYRFDHEVLELDDYNSYAMIYKRERIGEVIPTDSNPRFSSVGGVFQYKSDLMNWSTRFVSTHTIPAAVVGAKFLYEKDTTSLILWTRNTIYRYVNIFDTASHKTLSVPPSYLGTDGIIDCSKNMVITNTFTNPKLLLINWTGTPSITDLGRALTDVRFYVDGLDNDINMLDDTPDTSDEIQHRFNPDRIRTSITRSNWYQTAADAEVALNLAAYGKYLANYRDTFILQKISNNKRDGIIVLGIGGIGANIGLAETQVAPVGLADGYDFYDLIDEDKVKFQFLSTSMIRMYAKDDSGNLILDNIIRMSANDFSVQSTRDALRGKLRFMRITATPMDDATDLIFGDGIVLKVVVSGSTTKITQL